MPVSIKSEGENLLVVVDGLNVAKRGLPGSPQAGTWVPLEPGWEVLDSRDGKEIHVRHNGVTVQ